MTHISRRVAQAALLIAAGAAPILGASTAQAADLPTGGLGALTQPDVGGLADKVPTATEGAGDVAGGTASKTLPAASKTAGQAAATTATNANRTVGESAAVAAPAAGQAVAQAAPAAGQLAAGGVPAAPSLPAVPSLGGLPLGG
ncbi:ATP-binding protein [Embleya sp. NPDC008237]|uniref:ATP-binding protein n=1 Tax=Embleya sp. NPDC008237 TaxID=3363978 RepID=UPI0036E3AC95